ncbi:Na -driven multidrug efflux pump [Bifidobacterium callimiconis]|uniref:Na-driven multidrug efflux pump n=2 Tax=Bifidobacterium callimiconis TaxID=2306973 RepID=A0A430FBJ4_9BIFI|nr:Na -driven multidrug efflux pump [Bifidobacterium callimiconis]
MVFGDAFFGAWVPTQNAQLLQSLSLLTLFPLIVSSIVTVLTNVYITTNKLRVPALVLLGVGVVNLLAVLICLKFTNLGIWTVPMVGMITQLAYYTLFQPMYAARCLDLPWATFYKTIFLSAACTISMVAICLAYKTMIDVHGWIPLIIAGVVCSIITLGINFFIIFNRSERRSVLAKIGVKKVPRGRHEA